jgi:hypothetical protein
MGEKGLLFMTFPVSFLPAIVCHLRRKIFIVFSWYRTFQPVTDMPHERVKYKLVIQIAEFQQMKNVHFKILLVDI